MNIAKSDQTGKGLYQLTRLDIGIILLVLTVSLSYIGYRSLHAAASFPSKKVVCIYQQNRLIHTAPLEKDELFTVPQGTMRVEARDGRVRMVSADCPRNICVHQGSIQYTGQNIVCVPNKMLVEIRADGASQLDTVAY